MNYKSAEKYLLEKPESAKDFPFGVDAAVFKVKSKIFAILINRGNDVYMNLKCEPYRAAALRDVYEAVIPGYHMNKLHWNSIILNDSIPLNEMKKMIDHSYALVVKGLKKVEKNALLLAYSEAEIFKEL
ncbi:MAG: MmcQ/YjbR family DNA-binding protein [Gammaproteobacteria bacterium]|nr:MmcQ/YjbR family DNA-binding protein [Gammaproteobacteria bacterium]